MLGVLTYPLYLVHQQIGYIAISRLKGFAGDWLLLAGVTGAILLAALTVRLFIDRPLVPKLRRALTPPAARAIKNAPRLQRFLARSNPAGR